MAGNFSYYCIYHPDMVGNVVVQAPVPEFPGFLALATVGLAVLLGLVAERSLRPLRPSRDAPSGSHLTGP